MATGPKGGNKKSPGTCLKRSSETFQRATDGTRTRDFLLGKEVLYQLSHCRIYQCHLATTKIIIYNYGMFVNKNK